jgi:hypothetical protein
VDTIRLIPNWSNNAGRFDVCTLRKALGSVCVSGGFVCMALIALSKDNASGENYS